MIRVLKITLKTSSLNEPSAYYFVRFNILLRSSKHSSHLSCKDVMLSVGFSFSRLVPSSLQVSFLFFFPFFFFPN